MDRLIRKNVLAMSGRAIESAGDVDILLLDKTGTITIGNRMATALLPISGIRFEELSEAAHLASFADQTPEGRSIVSLVKERYPQAIQKVDGSAEFIGFTAQTRMSGCDLKGQIIRKGAVDAVAAHVQSLGGSVSNELFVISNRIADDGGTPLAVASNNRILTSLMNMIATILFDTRSKTVKRAKDLKESAEQHHNVYRAMRERNVEGARRAMHDHLIETQKAQRGKLGDRGSGLNTVRLDEFCKSLPRR